MKIYLLEDNTVFTREFCKLLDKKWIWYDTCSSVCLYKYKEYDAYLIDLQVGSEMSYDVIADIKKRTDKPIVLISHHTDREKIQQAVDNGVSYIISKYDYQLYGIHLDLISKM